MTDTPRHPATIALHAGEPARQTGAPVGATPVMSTSFHTHPDAIGFSANDLDPNAPHFYTR